MNERTFIHCEVAFATAQKQLLLRIKVEKGTSAIQVVQRSGFEQEFPDYDFAQADLGIFAEPIEHDYIVQEGDRVEIYRALTADPKEVRRQLAALGKSMGQKPDTD